MEKSQFTHINSSSIEFMKLKFPRDLASYSYPCSLTFNILLTGFSEATLLHNSLFLVWVFQCYYALNNWSKPDVGSVCEGPEVHADCQLPPNSYALKFLRIKILNLFICINWTTIFLFFMKHEIRKCLNYFLVPRGPKISTFPGKCKWTTSIRRHNYFSIWYPR